MPRRGYRPAIPCGGLKHGRVPCDAYAVVGSDPPRCRMHLGKKVAVVREEVHARTFQALAMQRARDLLQDRESPHFDPSRAKDHLDGPAELERTLLIDVMARDDLMERLSHVDHLEGVGHETDEMRGLYKAFERAQARVTRGLIDAAKLGLDIHRLRIQENTVAELAAANAELLRRHGLSHDDVELELLEIIAKRRKAVVVPAIEPRTEN